MRDPRLSLTKQITARVLHALMRLTYGNSRLAIHSEMLATLGWRRYIQIVRHGTSTIALLSKRFGEADAQFLVGTAAMWNGCGYCCYGHSLSGSLLVFRDEDRLHPLHPHALAEIMELDKDEAADRLAALLHENRYERLRRLIARMYELHTEPDQPSTADDLLLEATLGLWTWLVECSIVVGLTMTPDEAFCPGHRIGRDKQLIARYRQARARERGESAPS